MSKKHREPEQPLLDEHAPPVGVAPMGADAPSSFVSETASSSDAAPPTEANQGAEIAPEAEPVALPLPNRIEQHNGAVRVPIVIEKRGELFVGHCGLLGVKAGGATEQEMADALAVAVREKLRGGHFATLVLGDE